MGISHLRSNGVDLLYEQTLGELWKLDHMINLVVALRYECKVGYVVGHNYSIMVSVVTVEMEIVNGCNIVVSCLGLRHEGSVWGAKPNSTAPLLPIYYVTILYKDWTKDEVI